MREEQYSRNSLGGRKGRLWLLTLLGALALLVGLVGTAQPSYGAAGIDMLSYFIPNGNYVVYGEQNLFHGFRANDVKGRSGFYYVKSTDGSDWEEFNYDGSYIYHLKDTSWATGFNQNVHCTGPGSQNGQEAYFTLLDKAAGNISAGSDQEAWQNYSHLEGARWVPRYMTVGQRYFSRAWVIGFSESNCGFCDAPYSGSGGDHTIQLVSQGPITFSNGWHHDDVIRLAIVSGAGYDEENDKGENFFYARGLGWVGFDYRSPPTSSNVVSSNYPQRIESGTVAISGACYGGGTQPPPPPPPPPSGPPGSVTDGKVLSESGRTESPPANASRNDNPVQPGQTRQAEHYWGTRGMDVAAKKPTACSSNRNSTYFIGWHQGDLSEYLVNFPSAAATYRITAVGLPDDPYDQANRTYVLVNVYVDGRRVGSVKWDDSNPRCNEGEGGNSLKINLSGYQGVHAVAFEFANDFYEPPFRDERSRDFYFDYFKFDQVSGPPAPTPPPSGGHTSQLHGTVLRADGTREAHMYVSVWRHDGRQFLETYTNSLGIYEFRGLDSEQQYNIVVNARYVTSGGDCGAFDRVDKSRNSAVRNNVELIAGTDNWHGEDFWLMSVCP